MLLAERERLKSYFETTPSMTVLGIQDTTDLDYTGNQVGKNLGSLNYKNRKGFFAHNHILTDINGVSLGLFGQELWNHDPDLYGTNRSSWPLKDKESYCWVRQFKVFQSYFSQFPQHTAVNVNDRAADIYELFESKKIEVENVHLVVRARRDRKLKSGGKLWETLDKQPVLGTYSTQIYDSKGRKHEVTLRVKSKSVSIMPSKRAKRDQPNHCEPVKLNGIIVEQVSELFKGQKKPIVWRLLTTMDVDNFEEALQVIQFYTRRWRIEEFHKTLKQGAKIEDLQLKESKSIENAITIYSLISCQVMNLRYATTQYPDKPIEEFGFTQRQFSILVTFLLKKKRLKVKPTTPCSNIKQFAEMVKLLITTSKSNRPPGVKSLWMGITKLNFLVEIYDTFT